MTTAPRPPENQTPENQTPHQRLGLSGLLTRAFIRSPLTPLLLLAALVVGTVALIQLPREEEPQISVPMVDIMVSANGLKADDAVELVTKPLETIIKGLDDVDHVYSQTVDDHVTVTARFEVGTDKDIALLRVHETIRAHMPEIPVGIPEPLIIGRGINDVPAVVLTLSPRPDAADRWTDAALRSLAETLMQELIKVDNVGLTFLSGGQAEQIRVEPDPERLTLYGVTLNQLVDKITNANRQFSLGRVRDGGGQRPVMAGQTLQGVADIGTLLITTADGRPVYVKDVATIVVGSAPADQRVWTLTPGGTPLPAVSLSLAKRKGANAVVVAEAVLTRLDSLKGRLLPADIHVEITRNYGETAKEKADELLFHLGLATLSIVALITLAIGWREGVVVAVVIPVTILLTLFAAHLMGYTINRVSLFALIFSIGILVDDAIVVVENISRHWGMPDGRSALQKAIDGVAEVGNPTIVATLTIVAALLPMMFVSGLMGPYMSPIPANASAAMVFSFFVAVTITPWLLMKVAGSHREDVAHHGGEGKLGALYRRLATAVLTDRRTARRFLWGVGIATVAVCGLFYTKSVTVKLLPFDNKSELQVVADLPEGSSLEDTQRVLFAAADRLRTLPELTSAQMYAGTAAPFTFNGLVRHYYLRSSPELGDLQLNLTPKAERSRASHAIALEVRQRLHGLPVPDGTVLKVVEVPPGPPVLSTLLAEIYGPDAATRRATAEQVKAAFRAVPFIVDIDDSAGATTPRLRLALNQQALEYHGVEEDAVYDTITALLGGVKVGYSHRGAGLTPVDISVRLPSDALTLSERLLSTPIPARSGTVELGDVASIVREDTSPTLFRRDGHFAEMVMADLAGAYEAPVYGMFAVEDQLKSQIDSGALRIGYHGQPTDEAAPTLLWDGEWEITWVTFRDMGAAFMVALLGIYLLVVAQFGSFKLPLVILLPVPLTLIGIVLGHWLFSAPFTAPSMIGFIALAGIIVRNSILLVDFIRHARAADPTAPLRRALLDAGAIRIKPIVLTAAAALIGAAFILTDPIFQGLALSLVFGLASSTALTLLVIPAVYVVLRDDGKGM
ncbi:efflux RND transporter permease subunit [Novispirillum itersonii]|uniref:Multidrug efflux pump subunit AcrB n=1 Tax=Novispirillum itersonii TaxID=189 RepID=A0A7W9ZHM0_NOVIT|nr:efflux RND transporter permease subunit [Novispirillum itersonii]MBB6211628.1 multidrug efflux pump subunit AcrB [Novispirillum itersonii]